MNTAYINPARIHLPNAVDKIAFDYRHVAKMLCGVVDKTRQVETKQIPSSDRKDAHRSRYLWFYSKQNRLGRRAERLEVARLVLAQTSQCWVMKEFARDLWHRRYGDYSRELWQEWMAMAKNTGIPLMSNVARMVAKRLYGILNAMKNRVSNGNAEFLNSKIRLLKIKPRGFRNKERFKLGVMLHYGKLNMSF